MTTYNSPFTGDVVQPTDVSYASYAISTDLTLVWPINGNVGDVAARILNIVASTTGLSVYMPSAKQVSVGQDALFTNYATNAFDVVDYDGNAIVTVAAGEAKYIYITDNATDAGSWEVIDFGATTSSSNASALAGSGLLAISNTLNQSHPTSTVVDGDTFTTSDRALTKIWGGGTGTVYLDASSTLGDNWFMLFKNNGTGTVVLTCPGIDLIDGQSSKDFQPDESAFIVCTGNGFVTVGYGTSNLFAFTALTKAVTSGTYNLTPSEASSVIQEYVGSLTGNVTVVYPPVVSLYVIANQTVAGGYGLTISTGIPGGATATIPSGQQATVICDGVNFLNANTVQAGATTLSLSNGTAGAPSLNFAAETNSGMYRPGVGSIGFTILGTQVMLINASGITITGSGTFTGGISGGTF